MVEVVEQSVRSRIAEAVDGAESPDAKALAELLLDGFEADELRELAKEGLAGRVRAYLCEYRNPQADAPGSSRWSEVADAQRSGELDLARIGVYTGHTSKWLLDCTSSDLAEAADYQLRVAFTHETNAARFDKLAKMLRRKSGAQVVGDLDPAKVRAVYDA